jgi:hypothetical protein
MKLALIRLSAVALFAVLLLAISGASGSKGPNLKPEKLVILSTSDVKGKTEPCG